MTSSAEILTALDSRLHSKFNYKNSEIKMLSRKQISGGRVVIKLEKGILNFMIDELPGFINQLQPIKAKTLQPAKVSTINEPTINKNAMQIKESREYEKFQSITGNRSVNKSKIEKISSDIANGFNMLPYCPIIVSENNNRFMVIDGQHRLEVSKKTKSPVYYVICNELNLQQIAKLNSRGDKWKPTDFLNCYINLGLTDYVHVRSVMREFNTPIKTTIDLLMNYATEGSTTETFQSGAFKCKFLKETKDLLTLNKSLFESYSFCTDRNLIKALKTLQVKKLCDYARLKQKLQAASIPFEKQSDAKKYLNLIEQIYNFNKSKRDAIY